MFLMAYHYYLELPSLLHFNSCIFRAVLVTFKNINSIYYKMVASSSVLYFVIELALIM